MVVFKPRFELNISRAYKVHVLFVTWVDGVSEKSDCTTSYIAALVLQQNLFTEEKSLRKGIKNA